MPFTSCGGCLKDIFITEAEIIDRYVGNQLWNWGCNTNGQLGTNNVTFRSSPVQTTSGGTNWKQLSTGIYPTSAIAAIKTDGSLWLWGINTDGILGTNSLVSQSSPVQTVSSGTNWKQITSGSQVTAALKTDGTLWMWGNLSNGLNIPETRRSSPVQHFSGGSNWKQISLGRYHMSAIKTDGTLWLWGTVSGGRIGNNCTAVDVSSPVQTVSGGTNWKQVSAGSQSTAAVKTDGTLWIWGCNCYGALGTDSTISVSAPVQTVSGGTNWKYVSLGGEFDLNTSHTAAIKTDGTLWLWGDGCFGKLGTNSVISQSSPVQTVSGGTNWKQVSLGAFHSAAIKTDGTLWTWGEGANGKLGNNSNANRSSPVQTVSGGTNWKQVEAGVTSTLAITYTES